MKEDNKSQAEKLFQKFKEGKTTVEEEKLLRKWYSSFEGTESNSNFTTANSENLLTKIHQDIALYRKKSKVIRLYKYGIAASITLISIATATIYFNNVKPEGTTIELAVSPVNIDYNKAIIELTDGRKINVEDFEKLDIDLPGIEVNKNLGIISFLPNNDFNTPLTYHTIQTPVGGEYSIVLPDGSKVKLNANSSIKFPNRFDNVREVEIQGEVYFQIHRDVHKKFIVHTNHQLLEVLGTSFNVKSYLEDNITTTTLESGRLSVQDNSKNKTFVLSPGQSAINGDRISLYVKGDQVEKESAWRTGEFHFDGENLEEVLSIIARWYDVKIIYQCKPSKDASYGGIISRDKDLPTVLSLLEGKENLKFEISGKEVFVRKAN